MNTSVQEEYLIKEQVFSEYNKRKDWIVKGFLFICIIFLFGIVVYDTYKIFDLQNRGKDNENNFKILENNFYSKLLSLNSTIQQQITIIQQNITEHYNSQEEEFTALQDQINNLVVSVIELYSKQDTLSNFTLNLQQQINNIQQNMTEQYDSQVEENTILQNQINNLLTNVTIIFSQQSILSNFTLNLQQQINNIQQNMTEQYNSQVEENIILQNQITTLFHNVTVLDYQQAVLSNFTSYLQQRINNIQQNMTEQYIFQIEENVVLQNEINNLNTSVASLYTAVHSYVPQVPCTLHCVYGKVDSNCTQCICNPGWTSNNCSERVSDGCSLECFHHGEPNENCTECICPSIFLPPYCIDFNDTMTPEEIAKFYNTLYSKMSNSTIQNRFVGSSRGNKECTEENHLDLLSLPVNAFANIDPSKPLIQTLQFSKQYVPISIGNYTYCIPSNIDAIQGRKLVEQEIFYLNSINDYSSLLKNRFGDSGKNIFLNQNHFNPNSFVENNLDNERMIYSWLKSNYLTLKVPSSTSIVDVPLSLNFKLFLELLPTYNSSNIASRAAWNSFFENWGVGIITDVATGGLSQVYSKVKECMFTTATPNEVESNYENYLNEQLQLTPNAMVTQSFSERILNTTIYAIGGNSVELLEPSNFKNWLTTIASKLVPFEWETVPITLIIPEEMHSNTFIALEDYLSDILSSLNNDIDTVEDDISEVIHGTFHIESAMIFDRYQQHSYEEKVIGPRDNDDTDNVIYISYAYTTSFDMAENSTYTPDFTPDTSCAFSSVCERDTRGNIRATIQGNAATCFPDYVGCSPAFPGTVKVEGEWVSPGKCAHAALPSNMKATNCPYSWTYATLYCCTCPNIKTSLSSVECVC